MRMPRYIIIFTVIVCAGAVFYLREMGNGYTQGDQPEVEIRTDTECIDKGMKLFVSKCGFCHSSSSTETIVGPGLKGILKNKRLPASKSPATPENIRRQLLKPYNNMPSFGYLSDEEIQNIIAYLNTL